MKIGIDIGGSHIAIGVVDSNGRIVEKIEKSWTIAEKGEIKKSIEEYIKENYKILSNKYSIEKVGISIPGNSKDGVILTSGNLGVNDYNIDEILQKEILVPITIRNDAKCAAIAENAYGCLKEYNNSIFLTLGTGIGGAAFLDNQLLQGGKKIGYEFGHMIIERKGIPCICGKKGCFERYASMKAFKTNLRKALGLDERIRGEELVTIIRNNKPYNKNYELIEAVIEEYIENLSVGIINLIEIFEPEVIGLGGSFVHFEDVLLHRLKEKIDRDVIIQTAVLGNDAGIIGATL